MVSTGVLAAIAFWGIDVVIATRDDRLNSPTEKLG